MKHKYICEFCGQEFSDSSECVLHEHSHNSLYFNNQEIEEYGIMHSGYRAGTAPALLYVPLTELQKEQLIRSWLEHQVQAAAYKQGCYQNKINYIVWRLGL